MPKGTETEKRARAGTLEAGYREAVYSPLSIAREALEVLRLIKAVLGKFNPGALSDLGVAALEAKAGVEGAAMNIRINLPSIKDRVFAAATEAEVAAALREADALEADIYRYVQEKLAG